MSTSSFRKEVFTTDSSSVVISKRERTTFDIKMRVIRPKETILFDVEWIVSEVKYN